MRLITALAFFVVSFACTNAVAGEVLSADTIVQDYTDNAIAADVKYKGKELTIEGTIADFGIDDSDGTPAIYLGSGGILEAVHCMFPKSAINQLSKLKKGQQLRIKGILLGFSIVPHLKKAKIINP
jgi:hypothetical protein